MSSNKPLASFILLAYNNQNYIREAVLAAFELTYSPLEIIISDDNSTDKTFEIIRELHDKYNGIHKIIINKNDENMGIYDHLQKTYKIANGKYVVHAAGDDISMPERVSQIVERFQNESERVLLIQSNGVRIKLDGGLAGVVSRIKNKQYYSGQDQALDLPVHGALGCTIAVKKDLIRAFPVPNVKIIAEDVLLYRRACLAGVVLYIPDILVKYRLSSGISTPALFATDYAEKTLRMLRDRISRFHQFTLDIESLNGVVKKNTERKIAQEVLEAETIIAFYNDGSAALFKSLFVVRKLSNIILILRLLTNLLFTGRFFNN